MIRSMYSAVSGLRSHQTMMDVIGNNIANVNTHGFKKSQALFREVLSQTVVGARTPAEGIGGTNPAQIGLGTGINAISQIMEQGALQRTGRSLDIAIDGDGFFVTRYGGEELYTRAGSFYLDANGSLVSTDGAMVQGWQADALGQINTTAGVGDILIPVSGEIAPVPTSQVQLGGNLPADATIGDTVILNVDVYDQQGLPIEVTLTMTNTAADEWTVTGTYGDAATPFTLTDNVLTFDNLGEIVAPADFTVDIAAGQLPNAVAIEMTLGGADVAGSVTQYGEITTTSILQQNGSTTGSLQGLSVAADGVVTGSYSNGSVRALAQIGIANFANPEGLERVTGSNWRGTANSGLAQVGIAGFGGRGAAASTTLEMSNVDLSEEFTAMIRAQRGFQANSRMVTTSDEMLQEVVNMKR